MSSLAPILKDTEVAEWVRLQRRTHRYIIFTNGVFDLFHVGHARLLHDVRFIRGPYWALDKLIVAVNSDESVRKLKGAGRPVIPEAERMELVAWHRDVDAVVSLTDETPLRLVQLVKPDYLVKGGDYEFDPSKRPIVGEEFVKAHGGYVAFTKLYTGTVMSTTDIIAKIKKGA